MQKQAQILAIFILILPVIAVSAVEHPFILWTREEASAIRKLIETEPWARAGYEKMLKEKGLGQTFRNLFRYLVMGDESVVDYEKKYLLSFIGNDPRKFKGDTGGGRHYDQYLTVLRYDILYDRLTDAERRGLEDTFRDFIKHHCEEETLKFTRTSWLPNMQWPRPMTAHLMAVALRDVYLVKKCFNSPGGWKYYFDDYLADGQFYFEEFGKQYSMIGEMFLWCRGVERLGLNELGYGYVGKGGATMRRYIESIINIGYPRVDIPNGLPHYPQITMGDARGSGIDNAPPYLFQKSIVAGYLPDGTGGNKLWIAANMNGRDHKNNKVDKMLAPFWFELAHSKWQDGHFDYFLAQMRRPGELFYIPSLFFGLSPIDPEKVSPPPAKSYIAKERGFAFLRAEESPAYWGSPAPAVAFQFATYYVHYAHDAFSLLGFYAFNRPIYINRQISNGYGGGCPWTDSARSHCTVMVDNLQYELDDTDPKRDHPHYPNPIGEIPTRSDFNNLVKYVSDLGRPAKGKVDIYNQQPLAQQTLSLELRRQENQIWPGVDLERALFLTYDYLLDVFRLSSDKPHQYDWHIHALGLLDTPTDTQTPSGLIKPQSPNTLKWIATDELTLEKLYAMTNRAIARLLSDPLEADRYAMKDVKKLQPDDSDWFATIKQVCALSDVNKSIMGKEWYDRQIGVQVFMLGEAGTTVYAGNTPESRHIPGKEPNKGESSTLPNEIGGTTLLVRRFAKSTVFSAVHAPFEKNITKIASVRRIAQTKEAIGVSIAGKDNNVINDRILYAFWDHHTTPITLEANDESYSFIDYAFIRIQPKTIFVTGNLESVKIRVTGKPTLFINGKQVAPNFEGDYLVFKK